jgi:nitroreductase
MGRLAAAMAERLRLDLQAQGIEADCVEAQVRRSLDRIQGAPSALLCSLVDDGLTLTGEPEPDRLERQMAIQSVGAVLQTLFLLAAEQGIATCWMAAPMYCPDAVRQALDLPASFRAQALVLLGRPADGGRVRPRRPIGSIMETR